VITLSTEIVPPIKVGDRFTLAAPPSCTYHKNAVIYQIKNLVNGKLYVGSASNFYRRFSTYRTFRLPTIEATRTIEKAIKKYGFENFEFEILEIIPEPLERATVVQREQHWIDSLQVTRKEIGYNMLAKAYSALGHRPSKETIEKMRKSMLNRRDEISIQRSKAVLQIDIKTKRVIQEFSSGKMASDKYGSSVYHALKRKVSTAYGYYWCYKDEMSDEFIPKEKRSKKRHGYARMRPIYQIGLDGSATMWDSITDINEYLGYDFGLIGKCCRGEKETYNGFKWRWVDDPEIIRAVRDRRKRFLNIHGSN
jgi:group I intron endonuclease